MSKNGAVPDAWDDDWESLADKQDASPEADSSQGQKKVSKAERKAKHAEANKQLWESAEAPPEPMMFIQARDSVPLKSDFKPAVKVLSRKPPPQVAPQDDGATPRMAGLSLEDDDPDSEEEARKKSEASFAERQAKAQREREEKQRKYEEVRERLFGSPTSSSTEDSQPRPSRAKGGGRADRSHQATPSANDSPARRGAAGKQLFDPNYTAKPNSVYVQKREAASASPIGRSRPSTPADEQPIRAPRGPDGSGRGGAGFALRGGRGGGSHLTSQP